MLNLVDRQRQWTKAQVGLPGYTEMPRDDAQWLPTLRALRAAIEPHMAEEENEVFPQLAARLSDEDNAALFKAMNKEGFKLA